MSSETRRDSDTGAFSAALASSYRVERELGSGGMATVYLAEDIRHGRRVAIKVLHPEVAAAVGYDRFLAEVRTTATLQHPHIVGLIDSGKRAGLLRFHDADEAYHTLYGLIVSDLHVRMLLGEPGLKDTARQAERAVFAFLRLYGTEKVLAETPLVG